MRIFKKLFLGAMIAAPLLLAPGRTQAGPITDLLQGIFGSDKKQDPGTPNCPPGTSVPINGGLVILFVAGLGLGAKILYDNKTSKTVTGSL